MTESVTSKGALIVTDPDGRICFWSHAAEDLLGWPALETVGCSFEDFLAPSTATAEAARVVLEERRFRRKDGSEVVRWLQSTPVANDAGMRYAVMHFVRETKSDAEGKAIADSTVPSVTVARKQLHDFNNLLTSIHACLELALRYEVPPRVASLLKSAHECSLKAADLANDIRRTTKAPGTQEGTPASSSMAKPTPANTASPHEPLKLEGTERILIVEDDGNTRMLMRAVLAYRGYKVMEAGDGKEALARQAEAEQPFDLAVLDINLPGMDGPEVLKHLRRKWPHLRAMFLSGNIEDLPSNSSANDPNTPALAKPFSNLELLQAVRKLLNQPVPATAQE